MKMNQSNRSFWKKSRRGNAQVLFQLLLFDIAEESGTEQGVSLPNLREPSPKRSKNEGDVRGSESEGLVDAILKKTSGILRPEDCAVP
jgi:hypothetical protein